MSESINIWRTEPTKIYFEKMGEYYFYARGIITTRGEKNIFLEYEQHGDKVYVSLIHVSTEPGRKIYDELIHVECHVKPSFFSFKKFVNSFESGEFHKLKVSDYTWRKKNH